MVTEAQPTTLLLSFPGVGAADAPSRELVLEAVTVMSAAAFEHYSTFEGCDMLPVIAGELDELDARQRDETGPNYLLDPEFLLAPPSSGSGGGSYLPEPVRLFAGREGVPPHAVVALISGFYGPGCLDAGQEGRIVRWLIAGYRAGGYAAAAAASATAAASAAAATLALATAASASARACAAALARAMCARTGARAWARAAVALALASALACASAATSRAAFALAAFFASAAALAFALVAAESCPRSCAARWASAHACLARSCLSACAVHTRMRRS